MEAPWSLLDETLDVEARTVRKGILAQVQTSHVQDEFGLTNLIQTKAEFSYVIAVMDRIDGWIEGRGNEVGSLDWTEA